MHGYMNEYHDHDKERHSKFPTFRERVSESHRRQADIDPPGRPRRLVAAPENRTSTL